MIFVVNGNMPAEMIDKLCGEKDLCIKTKELGFLKPPMSLHPDIQFHKVSNDTAFCPPECFEYYRSELPSHIKLISGTSDIGGTYPYDCSYNISRIGNYVFANTKYADKKILNYYSQHGYTIIHVNQGYTACNSLIIGNSVLTEDVGIHNTIMVNDIDIDCNLLPYGEISLESFPYGFIGGAAGTADKIVFWCGNPVRCSYYKIIDKVIKAENIKSISLSDSQLHDFGGIICFS